MTRGAPGAGARALFALGGCGHAPAHVPAGVVIGAYAPTSVIGYLDIETSFEGDVSVVGLLRADRGLVQLVGEAVVPQRLEDALTGVDTLCTFNGERFDLPVLGRALGVHLLERYRSLDLSVECRRTGLRGGLKAVEAWLGIRRAVRGVNGYDAMVLWDRWRRGDRSALETLLGYNRDDVLNLVLLERRLRGDLCELTELPAVVVGV